MEISSKTNEIDNGSTVLWKYGHLFTKVRKKYDDYEDFFISVLVDRLTDSRRIENLLWS